MLRGLSALALRGPPLPRFFDARGPKLARPQDLIRTWKVKVGDEVEVREERKYHCWWEERLVLGCIEADQVCVCVCVCVNIFSILKNNGDVQ